MATDTNRRFPIAKKSLAARLPQIVIILAVCKVCCKNRGIRADIIVLVQFFVAGGSEWGSFRRCDLRAQAPAGV